MSTKVRVSALLLSLAMSTGCSKGSSEHAAQNHPAAAQAPGAPAAPSAEDAEAEAVGLVIKTYNAVIGDTERSILDPYFSRVGEKLPAVDQMQHITLSSLVGPWDRLLADATTQLGAARKAKPDLAMIADAEAMVARAKDLGEAYRAANRYYSAATFKDDKGAGAATLHDSFVKAVHAYHQARAKVAAALEANEQQQLRREMARYPETSMSHQFRKALLAAKVLLSARHAEKLGPAFAAANTTFQEAAKSFDAFAATKSDAPLAFKNFHHALSDTLAPHAAKLARELNDPKAHFAQVDADLDLLGSYYNNLVQATNTLFQVESDGKLK
jgi:hypothetical protein